MVVLDANLKILKKETKLSLEKIKEVLFTLGFEVEGYNEKEDILKIEITPDRPDLLSTQAVVRLLNFYLGKKPKTQKVRKSKYKIYIHPNTKKVRPYTASAVVKGLKLNEDLLKEMIWLQEKLHTTFLRNRKKGAIGVYPMEKIKFPIRYMALPKKKIRFQPLDSFREMTGQEILEKHPTGQKYGFLLKKFSSYPVFIDAKKQILSMPPIINSELTGRVTEKTKNVFIECSGHDLEFLKRVLNILVSWFQDVGGKIYEVRHFYGKKRISLPDLSYEKIRVNTKTIQSLLGLSLKKKEIKNLLERMQYRVLKQTKSYLDIEYPAFRTDILHEVDVVDDVMRVYDVNKIPSMLPRVYTTAKTLKEEDNKLKLKEIMFSLGFQEVFTFSLTNKQKQFSKFLTKGKKEWKEFVPLLSSEEAGLNMLRISILPELVEVSSNNKDKEHPIKIFEVSDILLPNPKKETRSENKTVLSAIVTHAGANFTDTRRILQTLEKTLDKKFVLRESRYPFLIVGRQADVYIKDKKIGLIGDLHPLVLENFNLYYPTSVLEIDFEPLFL